MKIKEFAETQHVSYEAIRKKIKRYEKELKGHISKDGRTQILDDYAVEFLREHMREKEIVMYETERDEELEILRNENKNLLLKVAELQNQLLQEKDQVKLLQREKIELLENREQKKSWFSFWK